MRFSCVTLQKSIVQHLEILSLELWLEYINRLRENRAVSTNPKRVGKLYHSYVCICIPVTDQAVTVYRPPVKAMSTVPADKHTRC